jgi:tetratricopeptide (TPR) repeat protein
MKPFRSAFPRGRVALSVAIWGLGILALVQIGAIGWAVFGKKSAALSQGNRVSVPVPMPNEPLVPEVSPGVEAVPMPPAIVTPLSAASVALPAPPAPPAVPSLDSDLTNPQVLFWLEKSIASREAGDMKAALSQIRAASDLQPGHPRLLHELAVAYETMQLPEKAQKVWDEIYKLGPGAGPYFALAQAKFVDGLGAAPQDADLVLSLGEVASRRDRSALYREQITLRVPVRSLRADALIDTRSVAVNVQFYDRTATGQIEPTVAPLTPERWLSGVPQWANGSTEFFDITYRLPTESAPDLEGRSYAGYVVQLYYQNQLQDITAEPKSLAERSPPRTDAASMEDSLFPAPGPESSGTPAGAGDGAPFTQ